MKTKQYPCEKLYCVDHYEVSGGDELTVDNPDGSSGKIPYPVSISVNGKHIVSLTRGGAKDLIRCLLEVL